MTQRGQHCDSTGGVDWLVNQSDIGAYCTGADAGAQPVSDSTHKGNVWLAIGCDSTGVYRLLVT